MRFAIKTAPPHTTWQAMLDVFRAADDIDVFESGWTFDHFSREKGDYPSADRNPTCCDVSLCTRPTL